MARTEAIERAYKRQVERFGGEKTLLSFIQNSLSKLKPSHLKDLPLDQQGIDQAISDPEKAKELLLKLTEDTMNKPVPRHLRESRKRAEKKVNEKISPSKQIVHPSSEALGYGTVAHKAVETTEKCAGKPDKLYDLHKPKLIFSSDGQAVIGVKVSGGKNGNGQKASRSKALDVNYWEGNTSKPSEQERAIWFEKPIKWESPNLVSTSETVQSDSLFPDQTEISSLNLFAWCGSVVAADLARLKNISPNQRLPQTPYEIERLMKKQEIGELITRLAQLHVVFFGSNIGLGMKLLEPAEGGLRISKSLLQDNFALINLLTVSGSLTNFRLKGERSSSLTEVGVGQIAISDPENDRTTIFSGGEMDSLEIGGLGAREVVARVRRQIGSQIFKRLEEKSGSNKYSSRYTATLPRCLEEAYKIMRLASADPSFVLAEILEMTVVDRKFSVGDAISWTKAVNTQLSLPYEKHASQVEEYMFFVLAHLCRFELIHSSEISGKSYQDRALTLDQIAEFVVQHKLWERINGRVEYRVPGDILVYSVPLPQKKEDILAWLKQIIEGKTPSEEAIAQAALMRAIHQLSKGAPSLVTGTEAVQKREVSRLLSELTLFSGKERYLTFERLKEMSLERGFVYKKEGVYVVWGNWKNTPIRIAINNKGEFRIHYGKESVRGSLLLREEDIDLDSDTDLIWNKFGEEIWKLVGWRVEMESTSTGPLYEYRRKKDGKYELVDLRQEAPDKPTTCTLNPFTGQWTYRPRLLERWLKNPPEKNRYIARLAKTHKVIASGAKKRAFCPLDGHADLNKPSCYCYPGGVYCFTCHEHIKVEGRSQTIRYPDPKMEIKDYLPTETKRQAALTLTSEMAEVLLRHSPEGLKYLEGTRGINLIDAGIVGYLPSALINFLCNISLPDVPFPEHMRLVGIGGISEKLTPLINSIIPVPEMYLLDGSTILNERARRYVNAYQMGEIRRIEADRREIFDKLTIGFWKTAIKEGRVIGLRDDGQPMRAIGNRLIFNRYYPKGQNLEISGITGRTINPGLKLKMFNSPTPTDEINKEGKLNTPAAGFWIYNPNRFIRAVIETRTVVVFEGLINALSFYHMNDTYGEASLALCTTGHNDLLPFLRWVIERTGIPANELEVVSAMDFDTEGQKAEAALLDDLEVLKVKTSSILDYLPKWMAKLIAANPKLDMNDLYKIWKEESDLD